MGRQSRRTARPWLALLLGAAAASNAWPEEPAEPPQDLTRLSVDELADLQVTLSSRRPEARAETLGAIHVITGDEIRRSGATGIADALRGAPGVQVSRIDSNKWAVAVRGFASRLGRSVLVLVDGRGVWTPLFAGVYWEAYRLTFQGDPYDGAAGQRVTFASYTQPFLKTVEGDAELRGGNLLARWRRPVGARGGLQVQAYYDHTRRREPHFDDRWDTLDLDVQHSVRWTDRHETIWGGSYRAAIGHFSGVPTIVFDPANRTETLAGLFAQDAWRLAGGRARVSLGSRLDWDDYSGWHLQPRLRGGWSLARRHWAWASVARAVRTRRPGGCRAPTRS